VEGLVPVYRCALPLPLLLLLLLLLMLLRRFL
jgi:hypothetical protein